MRIIFLIIAENYHVVFFVLTLLVANILTWELRRTVNETIGYSSFDALHDQPGESVPTEPRWYNNKNNKNKNKNKNQNKDSSVPSPRIALIMFGLLDHDSKYHPYRKRPPYEESLSKSFASIERHVIQPAQTNGYAVDIFAHSWNFQQKDVILKVYQPNASRFEPAKRRMMFHSIEAGLELRRNFEKQASVTYDWVLVMRHDIFFYTKYDITELNDELFYIANWCMFSNDMTIDDQRRWGAQHDTDRCVTLQPIVHDWSVPDFLFVASPKNIDLVFLGLLKDLQHRIFQKKYWACCAHGIIGGRVDSLRVAGLLQLGRYKSHFLDFNIIRDVSPSQVALSNTDRGVWLHPNQYYNWTEEQAQTQCSDQAHYCLKGTNNSCPFDHCMCPWEEVRKKC